MVTLRNRSLRVNLRPEDWVLVFAVASFHDPSGSCQSTGAFSFESEILRRGAARRIILRRTSCSRLDRF